LPKIGRNAIILKKLWQEKKVLLIVIPAKAGIQKEVDSVLSSE
jgi:hypothetical protein